MKHASCPCREHKSVPMEIERSGNQGVDWRPSQLWLRPRITRDRSPIATHEVALQPTCVLDDGSCVHPGAAISGGVGGGPAIWKPWVHPHPHEDTRRWLGLLYLEAKLQGRPLKVLRGRWEDIVIHGKGSLWSCRRWATAQGSWICVGRETWQWPLMATVRVMWSTYHLYYHHSHSITISSWKPLLLLLLFLGSNQDSTCTCNCKLCVKK